jgi:hypothetical protein
VKGGPFLNFRDFINYKFIRVLWSLILIVFSILYFMEWAKKQNGGGLKEKKNKGFYGL